MSFGKLNPFGRLKEQPLAANMIVPITLISAACFAAMIGGVSYIANDAALKSAEKAVQEQVNIVDAALDVTVDLNNQRALTEVDSFRLSMPGTPVLTGARVSTGKSELPEMKMGEITVNANVAWLGGNNEQYPGRSPAILIVDNGKLWRGATLLKDEKGRTMSGTEIVNDYEKTILAGQNHVGVLEREGKKFSLAAKPIFDESGKNVIGGLTARISAEDAMAALKKKLADVKIGSTGYVYIVALPTKDAIKKAEDQRASDKKAGKEVKEDPKNLSLMKIIMHPNKDIDGKMVGDLENKAAQKVFEQLTDAKTGTLVYEWPDKEGKNRQKLVVFKEKADLNWVIAAGSYVDEFTESAIAIRNTVTAALIGFGFILFLVILWIVKKNLNPIESILASLRRVAQGDLTVNLKGDKHSRNEVDRIACGVEDARVSMASMAKKIKESSRSLQNLTDSSARASVQVRQAADDQSEQTSAISASTEELSVSIDNTTAQAGIVLNLATETVNVVDSGKVVIGDAINQMNSIGRQVSNAAVEIKALGSQSAAINKTVSAIKEIAEQTNLLALNAAIEAARAGEQGRGFAVVADEVRKLAEQSSKAATTIGQTISNVVGGVEKVHQAIQSAVVSAEEGAKASTQAETALGKIHGVAKRITEAASEVDLMAREQSSAAQSIAASIERMAQTTDETTAAAQSSSETSQELAVMASQLDKEVSVFRL